MGCLKLTYGQEQNQTAFTQIWKRDTKVKPPLFFEEGLKENEAPSKKRIDYYPFGGLMGSGFGRIISKTNDFHY